MTEKERKVLVMQAGLGIVNKLIQIRNDLARIPMPLLQEYINLMESEPAPNEEVLRQRQFTVDNLVALKQFMTDMDSITNNALAAGIYTAEDQETADRIMRFGIAEAPDIKQ